MKTLRDLLALFLAVPLTLFADIVTIGFKAEVYELTDLNKILDDDIIVGDILTGSYYYDPEMAERECWEAECDYAFYGFDGGIKVLGGGHLIETAYDALTVDSHLYLSNDYGINGSHVYTFGTHPVSVDGLFSDPCWGEKVHIWLTDETAAALGSLELPNEPMNLSQWDVKELYVAYCSPDNMSQEHDLRILANVTDLWLVTESPMEQLQSLLDSLVANPDIRLSEKQAYGLAQKGWEADTKFNSQVGADKTAEACNQMDAFVNQLGAFTPRFIPDDYYDDIMDLVDQITTVCLGETP